MTSENLGLRVYQTELNWTEPLCERKETLCVLITLMYCNAGRVCSGKTWCVCLSVCLSACPICGCCVTAASWCSHVIAVLDDGLAPRLDESFVQGACARPAYIFCHCPRAATPKVEKKKTKASHCAVFINSTKWENFEWNRCSCCWLFTTFYLDIIWRVCCILAGFSSAIQLNLCEWNGLKCDTINACDVYVLLNRKNTVMIHNSQCSDWLVVVKSVCELLNAALHQKVGYKYITETRTKVGLHHPYLT